MTFWHLDGQIASMEVILKTMDRLAISGQFSGQGRVTAHQRLMQGMKVPALSL